MTPKQVQKCFGEARRGDCLEYLQWLRYETVVKATYEKAGFCGLNLTPVPKE